MQSQRVSVNIVIHKAYAVQFAKVLAITSIAPFLTGLTGLMIENGFFLAAVFIISFITCVKTGTKFMKNY